MRVIGIGASAGGLHPIEDVLRELPHGLPAAVIVAQHLSPYSDSTLPQILDRTSVIPVSFAWSGRKLVANEVMVVPAGYDLWVDGGAVFLRERQFGGSVPSIDDLFTSMASELGSKAIGVLLSGAGSDGAIGLRAISIAGGRTFAQDESAQHGSMPKAAVQSGAAPLVLPPWSIGRSIVHEVLASAHPSIGANL